MAFPDYTVADTSDGANPTRFAGVDLLAQVGNVDINDIIVADVVLTLEQNDVTRGDTDT